LPSQSRVVFRAWETASVKVIFIVIWYTSTGSGSAAPRVAKPDCVVDGIFP
jgi:hypothetical protein